MCENVLRSCVCVQVRLRVGVKEIARIVCEMWDDHVYSVASYLTYMLVYLFGTSSFHCVS